MASCASTAPACWTRESTVGIGRLRTNSASESTYSGRAAYISGVKHHGKTPWMIISGTLARAWAMICQLWTTARRNGSLAVQALCRDSEATRSGYLAASHMPAAAPSDSPDTCARPTPAACMNAATSSANSSVV